MPATSNFRLSQGCELVSMYQRSGSEPYCSMVSNGSTALPRRFDILFPFLSSTKPFEMIFRNATDSSIMVAMACKVKNQPRVWSTPSAINRITSYNVCYTKLLRSLFRGRDDVYAKRWENKAKGIAGYSPACGNEWKPGICQKPKIKCSACKHKDFLPLSEMAVDAHLRGRNNLVAGIYPLLSNETCWFLAIDFDDEGWQKDVTTISEVCSVITSYSIHYTKLYEKYDGFCIIPDHVHYRQVHGTYLNQYEPVSYVPSLGNFPHIRRNNFV